MVASLNDLGYAEAEPFSLAVTGEAEGWLPVLEQLVGPTLLRPMFARDEKDLLDIVQSGSADAAVLDDEVAWDIGVLSMLRMIRRVNITLPVVIVTSRNDRRWMEDALRLTAFSILTKPLQLEPLLRQIRRMMEDLDQFFRGQHGE
ncbi:MAG TPA: response regulator [Phycisphaerae bacterium]|nr:response regulator [Phycisphaerae bacterium]